jgi:hypothetical protein
MARLNFSVSTGVNFFADKVAGNNKEDQCNSFKASQSNGARIPAAQAKRVGSPSPTCPGKYPQELSILRAD